MALTRAFRETVYKRAQRDRAFRKALLTEAVNAYLSGDEATGKTVLRDVINATVGFEPLAAELGNPARACIACWVHRAIPARPTSSRFYRCCRREPA